MQRNGHFDRYKEFSEKWVVPLTESKEIVEITYMGKSKFYKLKQGEKTIALGRLLRKEEHITDFIDKIKDIS